MLRRKMCIDKLNIPVLPIPEEPARLVQTTHQEMWYVCSVAKLTLAAGSTPSFGSGPSSGPTFSGGAFGAGSSVPGQAPTAFQPAPFSAAGFGQQQPQPASTGFGATNTAGMLRKCSLSRLGFLV